MTLHRLAHRGVLPKGISKVYKIPLCASCAFAMAHRRGWRTKAKINRSIRNINKEKPGNRTKCDHIISHQLGLIPQSTGKLTHDRFWRSVLYVDHFSDFLYNNLIPSVYSLETLNFKHTYERVADAYGINIESYHADNL